MKIGRLLEDRLNIAYEMRLEGFESITPHLIGPPGIGKSLFVVEWAKKKARQMGLEFVDVDRINPEDVEKYIEEADKYFVFKDCRLTSMDPVDLSGLPRSVGSKYVAFLPLATARLLNACAGILFLDEFCNESRPNMLSAAFKIVRDYKIGDMVLNQKAFVIAASNTAETSSLATSLPKPLRDRFDFIEVEAPEINDWIEWMNEKYGNYWDKRAAAYLLWKPSGFLANITDNVQDNGYEPPATPRGWTYVAVAFKKAAQRGDGELLASMARGKLGRVGESFIAFLRNKVPSFEELVRRPEVMSEFNIEQKYLAAVTVAEAVKRSKAKIAAAKPFLEFVAGSDDREFVMALFTLLPRELRREVYSAVRDNEKIVECIARAGKALLSVSETA